MGVLSKLWTLFFPDRRSEAEITRERQFIEAVNSLKTLRTTDRGGMNRPWFSRHSPSSGNSVSHTLLETAA